jgi:hypothetical protein
MAWNYFPTAKAVDRVHHAHGPGLRSHVERAAARHRTAAAHGRRGVTDHKPGQDLTLHDTEDEPNPARGSLAPETYS